MLASAGKAVCELTAVIGQKRLDHHRCDPFEASQEVGAADLGLISVSAKVDPARGPVDGHEQVAPPCLVGHLRQVLDVHVDEARLIVLERLPGLLLASHYGHKTRECCHTVTHQAAIQAGARDGRVDELTRQRQQVIQRQQQHASQLDHQCFLARGEGRIERVRAMRPVLHVFPGPPLAHGGDRGVVA